MSRLDAGDCRQRRMTWYQRKRTREAALVACFLLPSLAIFFLYRILPLGWNALAVVPVLVAAQGRADGSASSITRRCCSTTTCSGRRSPNTLIFIGCSPIAIALALGIALLVNSDLRGAAIYRTIVFLSYPLMTVAVGIIWRWLYDERGGFFNYVLRSSGHHRPAGQVPAELRLGAALRDRSPTSGRCWAST